MKDRAGHNHAPSAHWTACVEGRHVKVAFCSRCGDVVEVRGKWSSQVPPEPPSSPPTDDAAESFVRSSRL